MSVAGVAPRRQAARALRQVLAEGRSSRQALAEPLATLADPRDRALCEALVYEACRWSARHERLLGLLLQRPLPPKQALVDALLRIGLVQLDILGLPAHAAISATAEAVRALCQPAFVGLVNAVLRRYQRERDALHARLAADPVFRHAHPEWLVERLRRDWPADWEAILAAGNTVAPVWIRVNRQRVSRSDYQATLRDAGIEAIAHPGLPAALCLPQRPAPTTLPGWDAGWLSVQDGAAQALAGLVALHPGMRVLDACAAPGGKAAALLESEPALDLTALDIDAQRLQRMRAGLDRLGLRARLLAADAGEPATWWDGQPYALVVLDAPCSATGVIRRQPDIKLHRRSADLAALVATQARLLDALWPLLAPGGHLLYATCSLLHEENARQVADFLARHPDAGEIALPDALGHAGAAGRQRLPGESNMDGFYYALIAKRG